MILQWVKNTENVLPLWMKVCFFNLRSMDDTIPLRLERHDPAKNMQRFYSLQVEPNLFGEWCLLRVFNLGEAQKHDPEKQVR